MNGPLSEIEPENRTGISLNVFGLNQNKNEISDISDNIITNVPSNSEETRQNLETSTYNNYDEITTNSILPIKNTYIKTINIFKIRSNVCKIYINKY